MKETIEFPGNYQRYVELGYEALEGGHNEQALALFTEAYQMEPTFAVNILIANLYLELGAAEEALEYANEMVDEYIKDEKYFSFYIEILAQNHRFIAAQQLLFEKIDYAKADEKEHLLELERSLAEQESYFRAFEKRQINALKEELRLIPELPPLLQIQRIKKSEELPRQEFSEIARELLEQKDVYPLTKSWLIERLVRLDVTEEFEISTLDDQEKKIVPIDLVLPEYSKTLQQIEEKLSDYLQNSDPVMLAHILEENRLHFSVLYPFGEELIKNPELWVYSYLLEYELIPSDKSKEQTPEFLEVLQVKGLIKDVLARLV